MNTYILWPTSFRKKNTTENKFYVDDYFYKTIKGIAMGTKSAYLQYFSNWIFEEILYQQVETELDQKFMNTLNGI